MNHLPCTKLFAHFYSWAKTFYPTKVLRKIIYSAVYNAPEAARYVPRFRALKNIPIRKDQMG